MQRWILWMTLACCVLMTGCASVAGGNTQKMYVQAQAQDGTEVAGADCALSNDKGTWRVRAPGDTSIVRSNKRMEVKCEKSPMPQGVVSVESSTRAALFGNIIIGGVVGAVIDHTSGAAYEYPEVIRVVMGRVLAMDMPKGASPAATAEAMKKANTRPVQQAAAQPYGGSAPPRPMAQPIAQQPALQPVPAPAPVVASAIAPIASGYARIDDVDAVPYLGDKGRENYREWVGRPTPKAFALSPTGVWFGAWSLVPADPSHPRDPSERALQVCAQRSQGPCRLYAVNGSVVWTKEPAATVAAMPAPMPAAAIQPVSYTPAAPTGAARKPHSRALPPASGFADGQNVEAVPLRQEGKDRYAHYLTLPSPKAFVVYETGGWRFWFNSPDSMTTLLDGCAREGRKCWLYAVDEQVVWRDDQQQRIGRADQLRSP